MQPKAEFRIVYNLKSSVEAKIMVKLMSEYKNPETF